MQTQFITQTFLSWDNYNTNIKMIDFTWLHDLSTAQVNYFSTYYGITNPIFLEYLRTLGLRQWNNNGTDKPALNELRCQAKQRGYNILPVNCSITSLNENKKDPILSLFPNPANDRLNIDISAEEFDGIIIYNVLGKKIEQCSFSKQINVSCLNNGIYFLKLINKDRNETYSSTFIISK